MSVWRRLDADALIDASGVRRSCDTAWSSAVRSSFAWVSSVACAAASESRARSRAAVSCAANAFSTCRSAPVSRPPARASTTCSPSGSVRSASSGDAGGRGPAAASICHASSVAGEHARAVEPERRADEHHEVGERIVLLHVRREPGERLRVGARPRRVARTPRGRVHETADDAGHHEEHDHREHVLVLFDRERVQRRREVVVRAQERDDRRRDREQRPAGRRGRDHEQQVEQQHRRQREVAAHLRQREREQGQADHRDRETGEAASGRERGRHAR